MSTKKALYLIGNGPSLNKIDIKKLADKETISFNRAYIAYEEWGFIPSYYMIIDVRVLENIKDDVNNLITKYPDTKFFIRDVSGDESWNETKFCSRKEINNNPNVFFISAEDRPRFFTKELNYNNLIYWGDVSVCSLQIAYILGYSTVYLLGCDARYKEKRISGVKVFGRSYHSSEDKDVNHFRSDYFGKGTVYSKPDSRGHFKAWKRIAKLINRLDDFKVYSSSPNSRLNNRVFKYVDFDSTFKFQ